MRKHKRVSTYKPRLPMRAFVLAMGLIVAGIHVFILRQFMGTGEVPLFFFPLILMIDAFLLWWSIIFTTQSQVTLYDDGIELQRGGSKLFTTWDNVSHMGIQRRGRNRVSGLYLHDKVQPETKGIADKLFFGRGTKFLDIGRYVRMPMTWRIINNEVDQEKLLRTDFGKELHELAPHLFEDDDEWKPKNRLRDDYSDDEQLYWDDDSQMSEQKYG
ncbi:MAG: hypothetical protein AAF846_29840 [Chloroflexota bacterium]